MQQQIAVGSIVYCYYTHDWFDEGRVIRIVDDCAHVDMLDWIQGWRLCDLHATMLFGHKLVFVPRAQGWLIQNFGQTIRDR